MSTLNCSESEGPLCKVTSQERGMERATPQGAEAVTSDLVISSPVITASCSSAQLPVRVEPGAGEGVSAEVEPGMSGGGSPDERPIKPGIGSKHFSPLK